MLQDLERERPMEIDPLDRCSGIGRLTQTPAPSIDAVLALVAQRGKIAGLYDGVPAQPIEERVRFLHNRVALIGDVNLI